jgi:site-specific DNA recombinase
MKELKLIGYARVSSERQANNTSIDNQIERIELYSKCYSHELIEIVKEVKSAGNIEDRKLFGAVIERVLNSKDIEGLAVTKIDRAFRDLADLFNTVKDFKQAGKVLIAIDDNLNTSDPNSDLILGIMGSFAQFERNKLKQRVREGVAKKNGTIPITESEIQNWIADYKSGLSVRKIAEKYNRVLKTVHNNLKSLGITDSKRKRTKEKV